MSKNFVLIGSSGGAGKDTVAQLMKDKLLENYNLKARTIALADGIYSIAEDLLDWENKSTRVPRHYLQDIGEGLRSIIGKDVWINKTDKEIAKDDYDVHIITDVRKLREYNHFCVENDYIPIYIHVDSDKVDKRLLKRDGQVDKTSQNRSIERELSFIDDVFSTPFATNVSTLDVEKSALSNVIVIDNSYSLDDLNKSVDVVLSMCLKDTKEENDNE